MFVRRPSLFVVLFVAGALALAGCEPYMSMTDRIPAQTRRAAALLPETPRYVGMVNVETALRHVEELRGRSLTDSLRRADNPRLRTFLDATGLDLETGVQAAYGALGAKQAFSAVLFANLTPKQMNRYVEATPGGSTATYRDVPLYHLTFGGERSDSSDTLSVAIVEEGMLAVGMDRGRVTAMVDRHRSTAEDGLAANKDYMALVERVGHGSTAWLAGRDVLETALRDSAASGEIADGTSRVSQAGLQRALTKWTDRMLGLSEVDVSSFEGRAKNEVNRLKEQLREQAVSITLSDAGLNGEVYLTMTDNASASSVVDVAEGAVAVAKLSSDDLDDRQRDLLEEIDVEQNGPVVHVRFSLDRERLRKSMEGTPGATAAHPVDPLIRPSTLTTRRSRSINSSTVAFQGAQIWSATRSTTGLSTSLPQAGSFL